SIRANLLENSDISQLIFPTNRWPIDCYLESCTNTTSQEKVIDSPWIRARRWSNNGFFDESCSRLFRCAVWKNQSVSAAAASITVLFRQIFQCNEEAS